MCGIAGILRADGRDLDRDIRAMTTALAHRGPDGHGHEVRAHWALGHRRLAIIDLEGGAQPMCDPDQRCWISYNGEIYNYRELRAELESAGRRFRTHSDTEVVLQAYRQWGADCVKRFRGMFAFGIVDGDRQELFLARDPAGIKPLVYHAGAEGFAFASEIKALRVLEDTPKSVRPAALRSVLRFGYVPGAETVFEGVRRLPPGHSLRLSLRGGTPGIRCYWRWKLPGDVASPRPEDLLPALDDAIKAHLVADVPFGVFLSGGIDSTLVAWRMAELRAEPVKAYCIGFADPAVDELEHARKVAAGLGIELCHQVLGPVDFAKTADILALYDEPFADGSAIPTWHVSALARRDVPMVLSGDGGDELFGGYRRYDGWMDRCGNDRKSLRFRLRHKRAKAAAQLLASGQDVLAGGWNKHQGYLEFLADGPESLRRTLVRPEWWQEAVPCDPGMRVAHGRARVHGGLDYARALDVETYLPDCILAKVDIASMACGLEVRPPLLDGGIFALAGRLRPSALYDASLPAGRRGKLPLRALAATRFAAENIQRPKQGFGIPVAGGFQAGGFLRALLGEQLEDPAHPVFAFLDRKGVCGLLDLQDRHGDCGPLLWSVLALCLWWRRHADCVLAPEAA